MLTLHSAPLLASPVPSAPSRRYTRHLSYRLARHHDVVLFFLLAIILPRACTTALDARKRRRAAHFTISPLSAASRAFYLPVCVLTYRAAQTRYCFLFLAAFLLV